MLFISSIAIINKTAEIGEPCGITLCKMFEFDVTLFIRTLVVPPSRAAMLHPGL